MPMRLTLVFCLIHIVAWSQDTSIQFLDNQWDEAISAASESNQLIFIDGYATWCGPCHAMDADVFTDKKVAEFFNENFVNLKLDMEREPGSTVASRYEVVAYPTFLFVDKEGNLAHKAVGFHEVEELLSLGKEALDPLSRLGTLRTMYEGGERSPDFLRKYATALFNASDSYGYEVGEAYLNSQSNWSTEENMEMVLQMAQQFGDPYYDDIVNKKLIYVKKFGSDIVYGTLLSLINEHYLQQLDDLDLEEVRSTYEKAFPASPARTFYTRFELSYYELQGDMEAYRQAAYEYVKGNPGLSWSELNGIAWTYYENIDDSKELKQALKWARKSVEKDKNHYNTDTVAALYYKLGDKKKAEKYALMSIELAKEDGADFSSTEELLEKILML